MSDRFSAACCPSPAQISGLLQINPILALMDQSTTNVKKQEMFRKRGRTVFNKADELARKCDVKVYCLLKREDKLYKYSSSDDPTWPPTTEELVLFIITFSIL